MNNTEFRINTFTTGDQLSPLVAKLGDGGFVVTWASDGQDGDGEGIYGQRYDSSGRTAGSEFSVSTYTSGHQSEPSVTGLLDGVSLFRGNPMVKLAMERVFTVSDTTALEEQPALNSESTLTPVMTSLNHQLQD